MEDSLSSTTARSTENTALAASLPARNRDPFQKEQDHLVEEVRKRLLISALKYLSFSHWCRDQK